MPTTRFRRQFASGCRPAPDPYDKFLDIEGFYRKHTARDASSLFRAISEQLFDTQQYHAQVRRDCVRYMLKNRTTYEASVPTGFDSYMKEMTKPKTPGTLLELRAMAYLYKRNILLYKPYDLGTWLVKELVFQQPFLRIFLAPPKHYDSVFTKSYIMKAAFCQGIGFEILYKNVFKLPDVEYAVETMLYAAHESDANGTCTSQRCNNTDGNSKSAGGTDRYGSQLILDDGCEFQLDKPEHTECILDNFMLCHFHNPNFNMNTMNNTVIVANPHWNQEQSDGMMSIQHLIGACLPDKYISCVRQLLMEGITPFPYKVAKALDPDIYRNIEFDSWSDCRKEIQSKMWFSKNERLQVGTKCMIKMNASDRDLYQGHIQEMSPNKGPCVVFVEELGEKRVVPYANLQTFSNMQQPWMSGYRYCFKPTNANFETNNIRSDKKYSTKRNKKCDSSQSDPLKCTKAISVADVSYKYGGFNGVASSVDFEQYTSLSNFQPYPYEIVAMPLAVARSDRSAMASKPQQSVHNRNNGSSNQQQITERGSLLGGRTPQPDDVNEYNRNSSNVEMQEPPPPMSAGEMAGPPMAPGYVAANGANGLVQYFYSPAPGFADQNVYAATPTPGSEMGPPPGMYPLAPGVSYGGAIPLPATNNAMYTSVPYGVWSNFNQPLSSTGAMYNPSMYPQSGGYFVPASPNPMPIQGIQSVMVSLPIRRKDLLQSHGRVNTQAAPSFAPNGIDLPSHDMATLRFFYNLGHEYFQNLSTTYGLGPILSIIEQENPFFGAETDRYDGSGGVATDFQQMNIDNNKKMDTSNSTNSHNKPKGNESFHSSNGGRRNITVRAKKDAIKPGDRGDRNERNDRSYGPPNRHTNAKNNSSRNYNSSIDGGKDGKGGKGQFNESGNQGSGGHGGYQHPLYGQPFGDASDQQASTKPMNPYTPPTYPFTTNNPSTPRASSRQMFSPHDQPLDNGDAFYVQPPCPVYQHTGPPMSAPYSVWYPSPNVVSAQPQSSLNTSSASNGSTNANINSSLPSQ